MGFPRHAGCATKAGFSCWPTAWVELNLSLCFQSTHLTTAWASAELAAVGITAGTVRMSVGLEDTRDLIADLQQTLS